MVNRNPFAPDRTSSRNPFSVPTKKESQKKETNDTSDFLKSVEEGAKQAPKSSGDGGGGGGSNFLESVKKGVKQGEEISQGKGEVLVQSKSPSDASIEPFDAKDFDTQYKKPVASAFIESVKSVGNVEVIGKQGFGAYFEQIGEPFETTGAGGGRGAQIGGYTPAQIELLQQYNVTTPFVSKDIVQAYGKGKTENQIIRELLESQGEIYLPADVRRERISQQISSTLQPKFQEKVLSGEFEVDKEGFLIGEGKKRYEKEFKEQFDIKTADVKKIYGSFESFTDVGKERSKTISTSAEIGSLVGVSAAAPVVGLGIIGGISSKELSSAFAPDINLGERALRGGVGVAGLGLSIAGFKGVTSSIEKQIVGEELFTLSKKPIKFDSFQISSGDDTILAFTGKQRFGDLQRNFLGKGKVVEQGRNLFLVPKGNLQVETKGALDWRLFPGTKTEITQVSEGVFGTKSLRLSPKQAGEFAKELYGGAVIPDQLSSNFQLTKSVFVPKQTSTAIFGVDIPKQKITKFATGVELFGKPSASFNLGLSKQIEKDALGNLRFFGTGTGVKAGFKVAKPQQAGITTIIDASTPSTKIIQEGKGFVGGVITKTKPSIKFDTSTIGLGQFSQDITQSSLPSAGTNILSKTAPSSSILGGIKIKQSQMTESVVSPKFKQKPLTGFVQGFASGGKSKPGVKAIPSFSILSSEAISQIPKSRFNVAQIPKQKASQELQQKIPGVPGFPSPKVPVDFGGFRFGFPFVPFTFGFEPKGTGPIKTKRTFKRTPSLGAVLKLEFGFKQPKFSKALEQTGLVERAFIKPQNLPSLGPISI